MEYKVLCSTVGMSKEEWLRARMAGLGGSDAGAVCGVNRWKSPMDVYLEKIDNKGITDRENEAMYWGTILESIIAEEFTVRTGKKARRRNAILQSCEHPFMLANIDREIIGEKAILEIKTVNEYGKDDWKNDKIPDSYMLQLQHYLAVMGYEKAYLAALIGGNKFITREIPRDPELIEDVIQIEKTFWDNLQKKIPPSVDGSTACSKVIDRLYARADETKPTLQLSSNYEALIIQREKIEQEIDELETNLAEIENKIKNQLQDATAAETQNY
ncbi:MAG: YqaJ viral recombinase family protein, partial [Bacillota bacterium]|nr:YqaJ viral recombinase family protein [Bacillota bacterium]